MEATIGTCSLCGGRVTMPDHWHAVTPPVARCQSCGAVQAPHGPVIPMRPAPRYTVTLMVDERELASCVADALPDEIRRKGIV